MGTYARVSKDFVLMRDAGVHLGVTLSFMSDAKRKVWEPNASRVSDRLRILREAHDLGIFTWVSMEPVIEADEALAVIDHAHDFVNFWKVGKLNHNKVQEQKVDWRQFFCDVRAKLNGYGCKYYIKHDLAVFARKRPVGQTRRSKATDYCMDISSLPEHDDGGDGYCHGKEY